MTFILDAYRSEKDDFLKHWATYRDYLESMRAQFPPGAFAFATANWHYDATDPRCPHDAWVERLTISEPSSGERSEHRSIAIHLRLLGAYHDGHIELFYPRVFSYQIQSPSCIRGLGDWLYDEFTLSPAGHVSHEIEWAGFPSKEGSRWIIEASDIAFHWEEKSSITTQSV